MAQVLNQGKRIVGPGGVRKKGGQPAANDVAAGAGGAGGAVTDEAVGQQPAQVQQNRYVPPIGVPQENVRQALQAQRQAMMQWPSQFPATTPTQPQYPMPYPQQFTPVQVGGGGQQGQTGYAPRGEQQIMNATMMQPGAPQRPVQAYPMSPAADRVYQEYRRRLLAQQQATMGMMPRM